MATRFVTNLDLNQNQILNATFQVLTSDPTTGNFDGRMYFNSADGTLRIYDETATAWRKIVASAGPSTTGVVSGGDNSVALTITESGGVITITPNLATTSTPGLMTASDFSKLADAASEATASKLVIRDANGQAKFGTPTDDAHAATKGYVDAARSGLDVKASVRVATTAPLTLASDLENGDEVDGVTLATGDRVLVKNQSSGAENGIYVVQASGAAVRATDADSSAEVTAGMFTFVAEGSVNADSGWVLSTNDTITLDTTALDFVQFSGAGQVTAGAGLTKTGNTIDVIGTADRITVNSDSVDIASTYAGQNTITTLGTVTTGTWDATTVAVTAGGTGVESFTDNGIVYGDGTNALDVTAAGTQHQVLLAGAGGVPEFGAVDLSQGAAVTNDLPVTHGGTGASTEANARTNLAAGGTQGSGVTTPALARKVSKVVGNGVDTSFTLVHAFNTREVLIQVYDSSSYDTVIADTIRTDADTVTVQFSIAPSSNAFTIVVIG
jgi:hypothetical protein